MPTPTIPDGKLFFNATLYTGTGAALTVANGVAGQNFQPDLVWFKNRSNSQNNHLMDVNRGGGNILYSNLTNAEDNLGTSWANFTSTGFSIGASSGINNSGETFVAWQWKAGGAAVTNTAGTISAQVSANTTSGFSVVTYTGNGTSGATVGHGLGVAPSMIIVKDRTSTNPWPVYHVSLGVQYYTLLNATSAADNSLSNYWSATAPSSTVFGLNSYGGNNQSSSNFVAYCFAQIAGYSAFGSYTGNGSADGPFVYLGFRPRFVMIKRTDGGTANWYVLDSARSTYNLATNMLFPNLSSGETTTAEDNQDFLSNGFKVRTSNQESNINGGTYIYMAFAENPFKYANAR